MHACCNIGHECPRLQWGFVQNEAAYATNAVMRQNFASLNYIQSSRKTYTDSMVVHSELRTKLADMSLSWTAAHMALHKLTGYG